MPIKIQNGLPARAILESENVFIMDEDRAQSQKRLMERCMSV